jgi:hypothetical protein
MDKQQVVAEIIAELKSSQAKMGYDDADAVTPLVRPHGGLMGFQSDVTPTIARRVAKRLGRPIPDGVAIANIFVTADKTKKLTVDQAADRFIVLYGPKGTSHERPGRAQEDHCQPPQGSAENGRAYAGAGSVASGASSADDLGN